MTEADSTTYQPLGLSVLLRAAAAANDLTPLGVALIEHVQRHDDPYALLDLSLVLQFKYEKMAALGVQQQALRMRKLYRLKDAGNAVPPLRLLVLKVPGDLMANTPFECLVEHADLQIDVLYVDGQSEHDVVLPEHDVMFVAACASDETVHALAQIASLASGTVKPVLNRPERIAHMVRDAAYTLLGGIPDIYMAPTIRVSRARILDRLPGESGLPKVLDVNYPLIIRPVGSHAGEGLARISNPSELAEYLQGSEVTEYYLAPFVDYSSADGLFRKYRIVLIEGKPYVCHMGISAHWMVHYPYAEMMAHPERRDEEERLMASFDFDFAVRHHNAFRMVVELTGLDYIGFDCAETDDGKLLIFEVATGMVVHDMDDPVAFPYKIPQIRRVSAAFHQMLLHAAHDRLSQ